MAMQSVAALISAEAAGRLQTQATEAADSTVTASCNGKARSCPAPPRRISAYQVIIRSKRTSSVCIRSVMKRSMVKKWPQ